MTSVASNEELKKIRLDSEEGLIYQGFLNLLEEKGIITVGDLFEKAEDMDSLYRILPPGESYITGISNILKLLRCKYLNVDPQINFKLDNNIEYFKQFGFSTNTCNSLVRAGYNNSNFIDLLYLEPRELKRKLRDIHIAVSGYKEILYKTSIILSYYQSRKKSNEGRKESTQDVITQFGLSCNELENLLREGELSSEDIDSIETQLGSLINLLTVYKKLNCGNKLPSYATQYIYIPKKT